MKLAWFGPLPPVRSGIAHYASLLLPALGGRHDVTCVRAQQEPPEVPWPLLEISALDRASSSFDAIFCQLGNNPFHEAVYRWTLENPAVVVIHDLILHHLVVEMTLARGDVSGYIEAVRASHGDAGAAWAEGRAAGAHFELGNFLYPCFRETAARARHLIVHNRWAARQIRAAGVSTPLTIAGHPWELGPPPVERELAALRERYAIPAGARVISMLGFVTAAKRPAQVFRAFAEASRRDGNLHLLVAGQAAPGTDPRHLASESGVSPDRWTATGYVDDADFDRLVAISHAVVNLRYPSAGEMSGPLVKVVGAGRDIAVSDYAQFGELPEGVAVKIPFGEREHEALVKFMTGESACDAEAQAAWIAEVCTVEGAVSSYERAAAGIDDLPFQKAARETGATLPIFVEWNVTSRPDGTALMLQLRLKSDSVVRSLEWGRPGYRVIADVVRTGGGVSSCWLRLSGDARAGGEASLSIDLPADWARVELRHGLEAIPDVARPPFATVERSSW